MSLAFDLKKTLFLLFVEVPFFFSYMHHNQNCRSSWGVQMELFRGKMCSCTILNVANDEANDEANEFQTAGEFRIHRANFFAHSRTGEDMMDDNIPHDERIFDIIGDEVLYSER